VTDRASALGRRRRLHRITRGGVFALVAIDHRDSLQVAFEGRGLTPLDGPAIAAFKAEVIAALTPSATGVLLDAEHGAQALADGAASTLSVVMPLEAQGYGDAAKGRTSSFLPNWGPEHALHAGADACKLLLPFRADHAESTAAQSAVVEQAVAGCHAAGLPLILEPIVYRLPDESESEFAERFPALVLAGVEVLRELGPDVLKVQFPVAPHGDDVEWCRRIDAACGDIPWVLLGGGADVETFRRQVDVVCAAGASGYIVGRTAWTGAVTEDAAARSQWLIEVGAPQLAAIRDRALATAKPFTDRVAPLPPYPPTWL
jgi:tagatose-1,6-bisphosphate aldolase